MAFVLGGGDRGKPHLMPQKKTTEHGNLMGFRALFLLWAPCRGLLAVGFLPWAPDISGGQAYSVAVHSSVILKQMGSACVTGRSSRSSRNFAPARNSTCRSSPKRLTAFTIALQEPRLDI